eukprot:scaffold75325_cov29-Phaeocystis_antarctica.AAC.2
MAVIGLEAGTTNMWSRPCERRKCSQYTSRVGRYSASRTCERRKWGEARRPARSSTSSMVWRDALPRRA